MPHSSPSWASYGVCIVSICCFIFDDNVQVNTRTSTSNCKITSDSSWPHQALPSNLEYEVHQIPKLKCFFSRLAVVSAQSIVASCKVENEDVVGAVPTGDAPTTFEWSNNIIAWGVTNIRGLTVDTTLGAWVINGLTVCCMFCVMTLWCYSIIINETSVQYQKKFFWKS